MVKTMFKSKYIKVGKYRFEKEISTKLFSAELTKLLTLCGEFVAAESKFVTRADKPVDTVFHNFATFNLHALDSEQGVKHFLSNLVKESDGNDRFVSRLHRLALSLEISIDPKALSVIKGRVYRSLTTVYFLQPKDVAVLIGKFHLLWLTPFLQTHYQDKLF